MRFPLDSHIDLASIPAPNRWGARRKFDVHTGVDLFAPEGTPVYACEDGEVVDVCTFTGASIGMPWWNETMCVSVKGASGVILYGEITPAVENGQMVKESDLIGTIKQVLIKDKGRPMSMLHIEWYEGDYKGKGFEKNVWEAWELDGEKPSKLKNIEKLIFNGTE
jgi:murein DD-endopeptidase MepM/ murein hydrolase activator NlpD